MDKSPLTDKFLLNIEESEINYMIDRMTAIQSREGNPEGIEMLRIEDAVCFYSRTMPWASFNTVKGVRSHHVKALEEIQEFYQQRSRKPQFELVPGMIDGKFLSTLSQLGMYQSGFHTSMYLHTNHYVNKLSLPRIDVSEISEDEFEIYAMIHCRGTGLSDDGIPYVAQNNRILHNRNGWKFYMVYIDNEPAAVGVMYIKDGTASLTFAATLPKYRNHGLHGHLLHKRIEVAIQHGCALVVAQCSFMSQSHRNMDRVGMKIAYVRTNWTEQS